MSTISNLILKALDELLKDDFRRFKASLTNNMAQGFDSIPRGKLEEAKQLDVMGLMVDRFGESEAASITVKVLKQIQQNKVASELEKNLEGLEGEASEEGSTTEHVTKQSKGADFVDKHRKALVQRVSSVMEIADGLLSKDMITGEMYSTVRAAATPQEQMRNLFGVLNTGGRLVKEEFYKILTEKHPHLVEDLEG